MAKPNGPHIRVTREGQAIRRRELAAAVGISYDHLAGIENGHNSAAIETLVKIAKALGVPIGDVLKSDWAGVA